MTQATNYLIRFRQAQTVVERKQVVKEYETYFETLTEPQQQQARLETQPLRADIQQTLDELDQLAAQAEEVLASQQRSQPVRG